METILLTFLDVVIVRIADNHFLGRRPFVAVVGEAEAVTQISVWLILAWSSSLVFFCRFGFGGLRNCYVPFLSLVPCESCQPSKPSQLNHSTKARAVGVGGVSSSMNRKATHYSCSHPRGMGWFVLIGKCRCLIKMESFPMPLQAFDF